MKTLYLDCFSGISGDMFLGALIDLGFKPSTLEWELQKLALAEEFHLHISREDRMAISAVRFEVHSGRTHGEQCEHHDHDEEHHCCGHHHEEGHSHDEEHPHEAHEHTHEEHSHEHGDCGCHSHEHEGHSHDHGEDEHDHHDEEHTHPHEHRSYQSIKEMIETSTLHDEVKLRAISIFHRIAEAEAKIHGKTVDDVHFHEVGALDSIVDIVGAVVALRDLGIDQVEASQPIEGTGWVRCQHGRFPLPSPATLEILKGIPISQQQVPHELITPTGAAILAEFSVRFGPLLDLKQEKVGYGAGKRHLEDRPNVLRAILGIRDSASPSLEFEKDQIIKIECNLDDIDGQSLGQTTSLLLKAGAFDVSTTAIQMKKNRPGIQLQVLAEENLLLKLADIILRDTPALGFRYQKYDRLKLRRDFVTVLTPFGNIRLKRGFLGTDILKAKPEFEDCAAAALQHSVPVSRVIESALSEARRTGLLG